MFNQSFYPTPAWLAEKLARELADYRYKPKTVLEPSAGKADLLKPLAVRLQGYSPTDKGFAGLDIDTIEIEPDLRAILTSHGLRVVHDDFLTFHTLKHYDLILMNPPFSAGAKHALHALDLLKNNGGGKLACLLNAETLANPCTNERRELVQILTDLDAKVEFINDAFATAERKAAVDVAMIQATVPGRAPISTSFEGMKKAAEERAAEATHTQLVPTDTERQMVQRYEVEAAALKHLLEEYSAMRPYMSTSFAGATPILSMQVYGQDDRSRDLSLNACLRLLRKKYWGELLKNPAFMAMFTSNIQALHTDRINELADYDFTLHNIYTLRIKMLAGLVEAAEATIIQLFEDMTSPTMDNAKNIHYYNGWKTNKGYKVGQRVILKLDGYADPDNYQVKEKLSDIEKVFNFLDGGRTREISVESRLKSAVAHGIRENIDLKYFTITFYKKGTAHFQFKNMELVKEFNIFGGQRKNWLPPNYGRTAYADMTREEKSVVDSFEGQAAYRETVQKARYYLFDMSKALELTQGQQPPQTA